MKTLFKKISKSTFLLFEIELSFCRTWNENVKRSENKLEIEQKETIIKKIQIKFKINDKVFLNAKNIIFIKLFKKLNYKYYKLYTINASINIILYQLHFFFIMKNIHNVFHVFFLEFVKNKNNETSSFIWIKNEKRWKIKKVVDKKIRNDKTSYLMRMTRIFAFEQWMNKNKWYKKCSKIIQKFLNMSLTKNDKCIKRR